MILMRRNFFTLATAGLLLLGGNYSANAQNQATAPSADQLKAAAAKLTSAKSKIEYPSVEKVTKGYTEVKPSDGKTPYLKLWISDKKDGQMLAQLPRDYASSKHRTFIATTVASGEQFAGLQNADFYVYWKKYGKRLALIAENISIRGSDAESKSSVDRIFTDRVLIDVPILTMVPRGGPMIDLDDLFVRNASTFFGSRYRSTRNLIGIKKAKSYEKNSEIAFEVPTALGGLQTLHYSVSKIEGTKGFKPRKADERIGYFTTSFRDYGKYEADDTNIRYINRWNLEKRDSKLTLSPPKKPIIFYIEHTTPVRYRRWVRQGILNWNKAFEQVGILDAIEVRQQDKSTNDHMDKDPENVKYNFIRWLNNNISTAIGPSRVDPRTGEILDADIVLTDGWIRTFEDQFDELMPKIAMQGVSPETLAWYAKFPNWDPRVRLAPPSQRNFIRDSIQQQAAQKNAGHALAAQQTILMGDEPLDGLTNRVSQTNGACFAAEGKSLDVAMMRMMKHHIWDKQKLNLDDEDKDKDKDDDEKDEDKEEDKKPKEQMLDGMPESFIGPLLADLVSHEVGHTLGLRHNFKASSIYSLNSINSEEIKGKEPMAGSVMDYLPTNFNFKAGETQGDYAMIGVGPYDMWAIEYGYTASDKSLKKILSRVAEPHLQFATDEDTLGPDPLAQRYDFSEDPLDFANEQVALAKHHRAKIVEDFVEDGDSWSKARDGYLLTLSLQAKATNMMSRWIGGTFVHRDKKGDPNGRKPIEVVPAEQQRDALNFVIENTMYDEAYGLTPELLSHMTSDAWNRGGGGFFFTNASTDPAWPVHDRVLGMQSLALSQIMDPTRLRRVYDNEFRVESDQDTLTLFDIMDSVTKAVWKELEEAPKGDFDERKQAISSLRRNLQSEHLDRLMNLADSSRSSFAAALKPISNLASMTLRDLKKKIDKASENSSYDPYTLSHLQDAGKRIEKWMDAMYVMD